ncbi:hypothetical protein L596_013891 [Steinernema carpocapsae]|uniref:Uncharacterized protein n=1 Tax=Steinernema carpocapsae TaxID=34508 RepID=A0A4U5P298_STECR|nr:hypothetical protein L596_013891 [Steinernema carpocapsae]
MGQEFLKFCRDKFQKLLEAEHPRTQQLKPKRSSYKIREKERVLDLDVMEFRTPLVGHEHMVNVKALEDILRRKLKAESREVFKAYRKTEEPKKAR